MNEMDNLKIELKPYSEATLNPEYDLDRIIFDLDSQNQSGHIIKFATNFNHIENKEL